MKLKDLVHRQFTFVQTYESSAVQAGLITKAHLEDYLVDFKRFSLKTRQTGQGSLLEAGDVVLAFGSPIDKDIVAAGIYHPKQQSTEPLTVGTGLIALRPKTIEDGFRLLTHIIPYVGRNYVWPVIRNHDAVELDQVKLEQLMDLLPKVQQLKELRRQAAATMDELIPSIAYRMVKEKVENPKASE